MGSSGRADFGVYFDASKTTSGQRFFARLAQALRDEGQPLSERPAAILFNVSAPISAIVAAKLRGQRLVLRIDGLYFDRLSPGFLATFGWPLRQLFALGSKDRKRHERLAFWANLLNENYTAFARILLADHIVYQSRFSQRVHERYFPAKPHDVIVNGAEFCVDDGRHRRGGDPHEIRLVTIFDEWKPAKRIDDLVDFVRWARETQGVAVTLTILGYTGKVPATAPARVKSLIETTPYIHALPQFKAFDGAIRQALLDGDIYITFTYRDPCPNTVVEAMAHGLPVVAVASGGVPDIVGDGGVLLPADDFEEGFFSDHRFGRGFPPIEFERVLDAIRRVMASADEYRRRARERFSTELGMEVVARRYTDVLRTVGRR